MRKFYIVFLFITLLLFNAPFILAQTQLSESTYGDVVLNYLNQVKTAYELNETDLSDLLVSNEVYSKSTGVTHYYINQRYQGIKIYNAVSNVVVKDNNVFSFWNRFYSNLADRINSTTPSIDPLQALQNVSAYLELGDNGDLEITEDSSYKVIFSKGNISKSEIPVELVYTPLENEELRLSWDLSIQVLNGKNWWSVRVDAITGEIIDVIDWVLKCDFETHEHNLIHSESKVELEANFTLFKSQFFSADNAQYNVFPLPVESPNHGNRQLLVNPANLNASPFGWHDTNGIDGPEFTVTRGNNVWAQEDRDGNDDDMGFAPNGGVGLNFNFPLDLDQSPIGYESSSLTNLFYMNNMMHDVWYEYGFDEVAGNFQENNYGNGGSGGDFVYADGQDGAGLNNATFGTPPDGGNPGMTMFLWSPSGPIGEPLTINNGILAGQYIGLEANFGQPLPNTPITAELILTEDFVIPTNNDLRDACNLIVNSEELAGKIVVIRRGECEFGTKILKAQNFGAVAVIMVNNVPGSPILMGAGAEGGQVTIPSIMVTQEDGEAIISELEAGATISASLIAAGPFQKDGSLDNGIIAHEYGHGISNRLTGGPSQAGCLSNSEQMGEGWSDWFALMMTMKSTDNANDSRGIGTYAIGEPITGTGIRPAPYTSNFAVNSFTYGDTNNTALSVPHGVGFVWATVLWDLTWAYVEKYGFDSDLLHGNGGNNKVMQLVIDGLKLQPCAPGFVSGRDALLEADMLLTGGQDQCLIWDVFSKRGLGVGAFEGSTNSRFDQVEDFNMPDPNDPTLGNCTSLSTEDFNEGFYNIYPNPTNGSLNIKVNRDFGQVTISVLDLNGRMVYNSQESLHGTINMELTNLKSGVYILRIMGNNVSINEKIVKK